MGLKANNIKEIFAARLRLYRTKSGLSISALAKKSGVSQPYISQIEHKAKYPSLEKAELLAVALNVDLNVLLGKESDRYLEDILYALESDDIESFPLEWFGVDKKDLVSLFLQEPQRSQGLLDLLNDLVRLNEIKKQDIVHAAIRSYRRLNSRYLLQLEQKAKEFRKEHGLDSSLTPRSSFFRTMLIESGYIINDKELAENTTLSGVRFVYVEDPESNKHSMLYLGADLTDAQKTFVFLYELYHTKHSIYNSTSRRQDSLRLPNSVEASLNDYNAKYFAEAVMVPEDRIIEGLDNLLNSQSWSDEEFLKLGQGSSIGALMKRVATIGSRHFGLINTSFVRFSHDLTYEDGEFHVERVDNGSEYLPNFFAFKSEHFCRRFAMVKAFRALEKMDRDERESLKRDMNEKGVSPQIPICVHRSKYVGRYEGQKVEEEHFVIAVAYPRRKNYHRGYSLMFSVDSKFRKRVRFLDDPSIKMEYIAASCERCRLPGVAKGKETNPLRHCASRATFNNSPDFVGMPVHQRKSLEYAVKRFIENEYLHRRLRHQAS